MGCGFVMQNNARQGLSPSLTRPLWWLARSLLQNPDDQAEVRFSVFSREGACLSHPRDAVLIDLLDKEAMFGNIVKGCDQNTTARGDVR
jgi:hypothetical protein